MWVIIVPLFLILEATLTFPSNVSRSNERYLFASSPDQCDNLGSACATLSSFAANTSDYLQLLVNSNAAELIFHPGNHTLHSRFAIAHINQLWVNSNTSHSSLDTNIVCVNHAARFEFTNISQIHFSNIKFLGCGGNRAESVVNFSLINTIFDGQQKEDIGRALELVNSSLLAERSSFVSNIDGGAVVVNGSNATFLNCNFEGNHADYGGAIIYGNLLSNISIINSTLYHNSATEYGGAISIGALTNGMGNSEKLSGISLVLASNFSHNRAEKRGGGMAIVHGSVSIFKSKFTNNIAILTGGAVFSGDTSIININGFDFSSNNAMKDGGAVHVFNSTLFISNGTFSLNSAVKGHGGALCLQEGTYELSDCSFIFNEAETFGGAIYTRNSQHEYLTRCVFDTNTVRSPSGGGRSMRIYRESNLVITDSFLKDRAYLLYTEFDGNSNHYSNCQESNDGYRVNGVGLIIASSTIVLNNTEFMGNCEVSLCL